MLSVSPPGVPTCERVEWFTQHLSDKCDFLFSPTQETLAAVRPATLNAPPAFCVKTYCTQRCVHLNITELRWHVAAEVYVIWPVLTHYAVALSELEPRNMLNSYITQYFPAVWLSCRRLPHTQTAEGITFAARLNDCFWTSGKGEPRDDKGTQAKQTHLGLNWAGEPQRMAVTHDNTPI